MTATPPPGPEHDPPSHGPWAPPADWAPPTAPVAPPGWPPPVGFAPPAPPRPRWITRREVRAGLVVVGVLAVVGVVAGFGWLWWSPPRGIALALGPDTLLPDETEAFVAADGRFAVITAAIGFVAGLGAWAWRSVRGPVLGAALGVGSVVGAGLTALVGRVFGGGVTGAATQQIVTPPLEVRATGLLALQAVVALLVYGLSVTVSARDDLGVDGRDAPDDRADRDDDRVGVVPADLPPPRS